MRLIKFSNTEYIQIPSRNEFYDIVEHYNFLSIDEIIELYNLLIIDLNQNDITLINLSSINNIFLPNELKNINNIEILVSENDFINIMRKNIPNFIVSLKNFNDNNKDIYKINFKNIHNWTISKWIEMTNVTFN
tara:strand:- start:113 stop:514 length:402 start_codon:yes stop_codon:yes gene_type:complete